MAGKRGPNQTLIGCWCDKKFVEEIDKQRAGARSQFVRDALKEKLANLGVTIEDAVAEAPDRAGKGGPAKSPPDTRKLSSSPNVVVAAKMFVDQLEKKALQKIQKGKLIRRIQLKPKPSPEA